MIELEKYGSLQIKNKQIKVLSDDGSETYRIKLLNQIATENNLTIFYDRPNFSRLGYVILNDYKICVKPKKRQKTNSPGLTNEKIFYKNVTNNIDYVQNIIFLTNTKCIIFKNPNKIDWVSGNKIKQNRADKSDFWISSFDSNIKISIKQTDAEKWESADEILGEYAKKILEKNIINNKVKLEKAVDLNKNEIFLRNNLNMQVKKIYPQLYFSIPTEFKQRLVFGNDKVNLILVQDFTEKSFKFENNNLHIYCKEIYQNLQDIPEFAHPHGIIRNDISRNCKKLNIPGLRVEAVYKSRVKNSLEVTDV